VFTICSADLNAYWILRQRDDATELNSDGSDGMLKLGDVHYQTERDLINDDSSLYSQIFFNNIDLQCLAFPFGKLLLNVRLCKRLFGWRHSTSRCCIVGL